MDTTSAAGSVGGKLLRGKPAAREAKASTLRRSEVFSTLQGTELDVIADECRLYSFRSGERIFERGDPGDGLFVVSRGTVRVLGGEAGAEAVVAELVDGDTFGELDLLNSSARSAAAEAGTDCVVLRFPGRGIPFETFLGRFPEAAARFFYAAMRVVAGRIRRSNALVKENSPWIREVRRQVYGDKLTGLYNKTFLEESVAHLVGAGRGALLMFKPDNFKLINDSCGHEAGDAVLKLIAVEVSRMAREGEVVARYMGNEIGVLLPGVGAAEAQAKAEALRSALNALDLSPALGPRDIHLTASFGVAVCPEHTREAAALVEKAHALPLLGRERGGNKILFPENAT